jgi:nitrate/nitrite-specific signal transduction histidine kinase
MTWWFRGTAVASLLGLAFTGYRWRVRTIERRNLDLERQLIERKQAEETQRRLNRELQAISNCNQTLLRAKDEQTLLNEVCRIVCNEAGYRMAWVGFAEQDEAKTVRPVAWAGVEDGCRCNIALPLKDEASAVFGALTIYSAESNAFPPDEVRLLEELAGDLAFGISALRLRAERGRAEAELLKLNQELEERVKARTTELEAKNRDLERLNKVFVGRELRMAELKEQLRALEKRAAN